MGIKIGFLLAFLFINGYSHGQNTNISCGLDFSINANSTYLLDQQTHRMLIRYNFGPSFGPTIAYHFPNSGIIKLSSIISFSNFTKFKYINGSEDHIEEIYFETPLLYKSYITKRASESQEGIFLISGFNFSFPLKSKYYLESPNSSYNLDRKMKLTSILGIGFNRELNHKYYYVIDLHFRLNILKSYGGDPNLNNTNIDKFAVQLGIYRKI